MTKPPGWLRGILYDVFRDDLREGLDAVVEARRSLGGYKVSVKASVLLPVCIDCPPSDLLLFLPEWRPPDISVDDWQLDLLLLGIPGEVIAQMEEDVAEGIDPARGPYCRYCNRPLPYWEDENCACYAIEEPLSKYIGYRSNEDAVEVGKQLKKQILEVYGSVCFGCNQPLRRSEVTVDHIIPKSAGGTADLFNLQPLCESCNNEKDDQPPGEKAIVFHFPVRPKPSDSFEGFIW